MSVAQAGFFSGLSGMMGTQAQADTVSSPSQSSILSQNMPILQANVSSIFVADSKDTKKDSKNTVKDTSQAIDPNVSVNILSENALLPSAGPQAVNGTDSLDASSADSSFYVVHKGDTISQIADMFGVSVNTILSANDMKKGEKLVEGDILFILPISGVEHTVAKGQTLKSLAKLYKVDADDIAAYNGLASDTKLALGDKLLIPGGDDMSDEGGDKPAPNLGSSVVKDKNYYASHPLQTLLGYFINPLPTGHKTQGLHGPGHRGIDIGAPTGTELYAAASGAVIATKTGCKVGQSRCGGGYGNMVIISHPNGTKTLYAHMSKLNVGVGDRVSQGSLIGLVGNTGHSTGPHVHFEVFSAKNPGSDWSWANN